MKNREQIIKECTKYTVYDTGGNEFLIYDAEKLYDMATEKAWVLLVDFIDTNMPEKAKQMVIRNLKGEFKKDMDEKI